MSISMNWPARTYVRSRWQRPQYAWCACMSRRQVIFLFSGILLLTCSAVLIAYSMSQPMVFFTASLVATSAVFLLIVLAVALNKVLQKSKDVPTAREGAWTYRIEQIEI